MNNLNSASPSSLSGRFLGCEKVVDLISPVIEDWRHLNIAVLFWMAQLFVLALIAVSICAVVME